MSTPPGLAVAAVARRLGVAPATLRTWDRRYGLGPSQHRAGSHRRYTDDDVARLVVMRRLTLDGVAPADAARAALAADAEELDAHRGVIPADAAGLDARSDADDLEPEEAPVTVPDVPARPFLRAVPGGDSGRGGASRPVGVREAPRPTRVSDVLDAAIARHAWRLKDTAEPTLDELRRLLPEDLLPAGEPAAKSIVSDQPTRARPDDEPDDTLHAQPDAPQNPTVSPQEEPA